MDSDYDPLAAAEEQAKEEQTGADALNKELSKKQSTMSLKKIKTVVFPIKATLEEKKRKLV